VSQTAGSPPPPPFDETQAAQRGPGHARGHPELFAQLADGISGLTTSEHWRRYLDIQRRFHRYSYRNALLIAAQRPSATLVAGFGTWRSLGRTIRKGERAMFILAPMRVRSSGHDDEVTSPAIRGFKWVAVFDVAQTLGEVLPAPVRLLSGNDPEGRYRLLNQAAQHFGYTVALETLADGTHGDCSFARRQIRLHVGDDQTHRVKTLAHELAHAMLHEGCKDRRLAELEAESTAYIVCGALGLDSGDYSFGYVTSWAGDGEEALRGIRSSCARIQSAAAKIVGVAEGHDGTGTTTEEGIGATPLVDFC
jgi:antirestriction protein ArdC